MYDREALMQEVVRLYLSHHDQMFAWCEQVSREVVGYEPKQVLLLHGNELEGDHLGELLDLMKKRGYRFIEHWQWPYTNYRSAILSKTLKA